MAASASWASVAQAAHSPTPKAYLCTATNRLMKDPVIALCGHLFERSIVEKTGLLCPIDRERVDDFVPCRELKERIQSINSSDGGEKGEEDANDAIAPCTFPSRIPNAHADDIHGMIKLPTGEVVTGSKDASMKIWDGNGEVVKAISEVQGYKYWITALESMSDGTWISGTRDGFISQWDPQGNELSTWQYKPSQNVRQGTVCKQRNKTRINCLTQALGYKDNDAHVFTGTPRYVQLWSLNKKRLVWFEQAHANDWVYCIDPLTPNKMLVVIGSNLEAWSLEKDNIQKDSLVLETRSPNASKGGSRPHIASIARLESDPSQLAAASFDGSVKVVDYQKGECVRTYSEHKDRAWCIANVDSTSFASGADDKTIKIWDQRQAKSVRTIGGHPGRVSTLLKYHDGVILAGSCADDPHGSTEKGQIYRWDLRKTS